MKRILALILVLSCLLTGCSRLYKLSENKTDSKKIDSEAADITGSGSYSGGGADDLEVEIVDTPPELMEFPSKSIGNASFTVETEKRAKLEYPADGKAQSISITDASGIEWTLEIPKNALIDEEEISITPLNNIELDKYPGSTLHGILLEPDGLEFIKSSSITLKKAGETVKGVIFSSEHDGTEVVLSPAEAYEDGMRASVQHFSTMLFLPGNEEINEDIKDLANTQYQMALEAAEFLLEKPLSVPAPPSIIYECNKEEVEKQATEYGKSVCREEEEIAGRLISAHRALYLIFDGDENLPPAFYQLLHRMNAKIQKLIAQYEPQHEKFLAVSHAAISVWKQTVIYIETPALSTLLGWAQKTREHYMDKLNKEHDYKAISAAIYFDRICLLFEGDSILESIKNSMTFKLVFENSVTAGTTNYKVEGEIVVSLVDWSGPIEGEGQGEYTGFSCPEPDLDIDINTFPVKPFISSFSPCDAEQIYINIDRFGSENEIYIAGGIRASSPGVVDSLTRALFYDEYKMETNMEEFIKYYTFPMTFNNENETAAEKTFKDTLNDAKVEYTLKLIHTPPQ